MRYQQPQSGPFQVDTAVPLANGLAALLPLSAPSFVDAVDGRKWTVTNAATPLAFGAAPRGRGLQTIGATPSYIGIAQPPSITNNGNQPLTFRYRLMVLAQPGAQVGVLAWAASYNSGSPRYYARATPAGIEFYYSTSGGVYRTPIALAVGQEVIITHTFDGTTHSVYLNGVYQGGFTGAWNNTGGSFFLGNGFNASAGSNFILGDFACWSRALSSDEVISDAANPWQVLVDPEEEDDSAMYVQAAGGGITGTLAVTEGSGAFLASGFVNVDGTLARTEAGDTLAASGAVGFVIGGTLARTEGGDTIAASGFVNIDGALARTEGSDSLASSGTVSGGAPITGTLARTEGADTLAATNIIAQPGGGGGGGSVREVRAFAKQFDHADKKPTKAQKKRLKSEIAEEALELLPDTPAAQQLAPVIAQLVYAETAPAFANWSPARAMEPLPPAVYEAMRAKVDAFLQQIALQEEIDDEHVIELLLLG